jgi:hypothetical protein
LADFTCFSDSLTGPDTTPGPECLGFDSDAETDILDYGNLQTIFGG